MGRCVELEHTADVGLRVSAADLGDLVETAVRGMFALIGEASFAPEELRRVELEVAGDDPAARLRDVLRKLLAEFDRDGFFPTAVAAADDGRIVRVTASGGPFDPRRHTYRSEIKGVTWHGLRLESRDGGWIAEIVFDV